MLTYRFLWTALGFAVVVVLAPQHFWWWVALLAALAVTDLLLCASPRRISVEREPTQPVRQGGTGSASSRLVNRGRRRLRGWAKDGWQPTAGAADALQRVSIGAGEQTVVRVQLAPTRRGELRSEHLTLRSVGPLGLAGRQVVHRSPHSLRVLPQFRSRRHLPSRLQRLRELDGATAVQLRGAGTEFDSLRDYVRGDDIRSIDWRATARRQDAAGQHLVVRTWRPERDRRVILCLDASRTSAARVGAVDDEQAAPGAADQPTAEPRLDAGVEASLLLGALAAQAGDRVDFLAFHRHTVARASSAERGQFLHVLSTAASTVEPALVEADFSQLPAEIAAVSSQQALVVVLTAADSPSLQEGLLPVLPALTAKHRVLVASVRDPQLQRAAQRRESTSDVYQAAAAERALIETEAVAAELAGMGVEVLQEVPDKLAPALADAYIRLKATGKL
ncbi:DUF58 domain-containing protein [Garicola koreensis]|uniref:Uncharacterized protein (DUF58 family) n=1 Tax=Garicola koreensis TaxID=1262554 RepID=A0A7W5TVR2_9MICC|nr:uncharacterized protein (DUF58 family) [Garicola koreensis]